MSDIQCVPKPELVRFIHGELAEPELRRVAAHVDDCPPCQDTVVALAEQSNTFVESIRAAAADQEEPQENALKLGLRRMLVSLRAKHDNELSLSAPALDSNTKIGPYDIQLQLGQGGMGRVYKAVHTKLKRTVALKVLPASRWTNSVAVSRFEREMEAIGGLDHPNIVRASDAGEDQGMHYLVMEFVHGLDLARLARRLGPLPVAEACELGRQCAVGLHYAHQNGLVHRDVKPSNLMLSETRRGGSSDAVVKILDLGLALLGDEHLQERHELTTVGTLMGTLDYMSPEQGVDSHSVDQRTDIYSLGATLFKLLTGRAPYADPEFSTLMKKMTALATKPAPSITSVRPDLPAALSELIDRMLSRDPDDRFESTEEVATALAPLCRDADLDGLLREAMAKDDPSDDIEPQIHVTAGMTNLPEHSVASSGKGGGGTQWWLFAAWGALFAAGVAGVLFYLATDYGNLTISSSDPNAIVTVSRTNQPSRSIRIENGERELRLRAGEYQLTVQGDAAVSVAPSSVQITRGALMQAIVRPREGELPNLAPSDRNPLRKTPDVGKALSGRQYSGGTNS